MTDAEDLRLTVLNMINKYPNLVILLGCVDRGRAYICAGVGDDVNKIIKEKNGDK